MLMLAACIEIDDPIDGAAAHRAERDLVAREHDAVFLRPKISLRLVESSFERAYLRRVFVGAEQLRLRHPLLLEESVHFLFRPALGPNVFAPFLKLARLRLERFLRPWSRKGCARCDEVAPF